MKNRREGDFVEEERDGVIRSAGNIANLTTRVN